MNVNIWDVADEIRDLIRDGLPVDPDRLADPNVPIADTRAKF
jgi:3-phenylpropionate/trans-cinnamate dioxygenase ferredoxin reductase subunit